MTAICAAERVYPAADLSASGEFGLAGVPRAPDRRRLIKLSSADWLPHYPLSVAGPSSF